MIHQDAEALKDIQSLQKYILEVRWTYCIGTQLQSLFNATFILLLFNICNSLKALDKSFTKANQIKVGLKSKVYSL